MIQATQLRLGNYVKYNGIIMSVIAIESPKPRKEKRFDGKYLIELFDGTGFITATQDQVEGIELTEELLLDSGFEKRSNFENTVHDFHVGINELTNDWLFSVTMIEWSTIKKEIFYRNGAHKIESLHQLQNIVHALTNTEIKINLHSK